MNMKAAYYAQLHACMNTNRIIYTTHVHMDASVYYSHSYYPHMSRSLTHHT